MVASDKLSPDVKLSIDVNQIATEYHTRPRPRPHQTTDHIPPETKISLTINSLRYDSNLEDNIRLKISGGYLHKYLQNIYQWSNTTCDSINLPATGCHLKTLSLPNPTSHIICIHNKQPLASINFESHR